MRPFLLGAGGVFVVTFVIAAVGLRCLPAVRPGRCFRCGYDLRGTADRCSECGRWQTGDERAAMSDG